MDIMLLTIVNNRLNAQQLIEYLAWQAIPARVEMLAEQRLAIYLLKPEQTLAAQYALQQFLLHQQQSKTTSLSRFVAHFKQTKVTMLIAAISLLFSLLSGMFGSDWSLQYAGFAANADQYLQLWRWITPVFIHFGWLHLIFNLIWWLYLGSLIERQLGAAKLLALLLLGAIFSNHAQAMMTGPQFGGLSGVIYTLIAYCWLLGHLRPVLQVNLSNQLMVIAISWLITGYLELLGPVANTAHTIGLAIGLLYALKDSLFKYRP